MNALEWLYVVVVALAGLAVLVVVVAVSRRRARAAAADVVDSPLSGWLVAGEEAAPDVGTVLFAGYPAGSLAWLTPDGRSVFVPDAAPPPPPLPALPVDDPERTQPIPAPAELRMELTFAPRSPWADDRLWPPATVPYPTVAPEPGAARLFNQAVHDLAATGRLDPGTELGETAALIVARYRQAPPPADGGNGG